MRRFVLRLNVWNWYSDGGGESCDFLQTESTMCQWYSWEKLLPKLVMSSYLISDNLNSELKEQVKGLPFRNLKAKIRLN